MLRALLVLLLATLLGGCGKTAYNEIDNGSLQTLLQQGVPIYDVRRPEEWRQTGIVEGSKLLTFVDAAGRVQPGFLERFTREVGKDQPVILICRTGNRTGALAKHLSEQLGYTQVYSVRDGITKWIGERKPVVRL